MQFWTKKLTYQKKKHISENQLGTVVLTLNYWKTRHKKSQFYKKCLKVFTRFELKKVQLRQKNQLIEKIHFSGIKIGSGVVFALNCLENCQKNHITLLEKHKKITALSILFEGFHTTIITI